MLSVVSGSFHIIHSQVEVLKTHALKSLREFLKFSITSARRRLLELFCYYSITSRPMTNAQKLCQTSMLSKSSLSSKTDTGLIKTFTSFQKSYLNILMRTIRSSHQLRNSERKFLRNPLDGVQSTLRSSGKKTSSISTRRRTQT